MYHVPSHKAYLFIYSVSFGKAEAEIDQSTTVVKLTPTCHTLFMCTIQQKVDKCTVFKFIIYQKAWRLQTH